MIEIFSKIPTHITHLSLRGNLLGRNDSFVIGNALEKLPSNVTSLDLGANKLYEVDCSFILKKIPANIKHLNLGCNFLAIESPSNLPYVFHYLSPSIKELNLSSNGIYNLRVEQFELLENCFIHLEKLFLSYEEVAQMSQDKQKILRKILAPVPDIIMIDKFGNVMGQPFSLKRANYAKKFGLNSTVPSLLYQSAFFVKKDLQNKGISESSLPIPEELKELLSSLP
ncbi:hypothetical protein [Fluoribacter gormanii]|uniref:hypothetical protein n=1 Tax=Fluoribacter gormanii TaxID=464 RepID=UPI0013EF9B91|nr:hypothetical protein [Fluoribacter gormanii]